MKNKRNIQMFLAMIFSPLLSIYAQDIDFNFYSEFNLNDETRADGVTNLLSPISDSEQEISIPSGMKNIVLILSDGYNNGINDKEKFASACISMVKTIELSSPFAEYFDYFEFYPVKIIESNSGVTHPQTIVEYPNPSDCSVQDIISPCDAPSVPILTVVPAFGSSLDNFGIHRGLASDIALVHSFVDNVLEWDYNNLFIIVVSNTDLYAGTANIDNKLFTIAGNFTDGINIPYGDEQGAVHEFGHSFAMLQDDYFFKCPHCEGFNCLTFNSAPNRYEGPEVNVIPPYTALPWEHWFDSNGDPLITTPPIGNIHLSNSDPDDPNQELRKSCSTGCKMYDITKPSAPSAAKPSSSAFTIW
ncbi:MAG: hypothetical protein R2850_12965 [Bacteroidia bacterium]